MDITKELLDNVAEGRTEKALSEFKNNMLVDIILDNTDYSSPYSDTLEIKNTDKILDMMRYLYPDEYKERMRALDHKEE